MVGCDTLNVVIGVRIPAGQHEKAWQCQVFFMFVQNRDECNSTNLKRSEIPQSGTRWATKSFERKLRYQ